MKTGKRAVLPRYFNTTTSPFCRPRASASFGPIHAEVSHVIFVSGFGSSCSQPLFANRPSHTVGSGRKMISRPPWLPSLDEAWDDPEALQGSGLGCIGTAVGAAGRGAGEAGVAL